MLGCYRRQIDRVFFLNIRILSQLFGYYPALTRSFVGLPIPYALQNEKRTADCCLSNKRSLSEKRLRRDFSAFQREFRNEGPETRKESFARKSLLCRLRQVQRITLSLVGGDIIALLSFIFLSSSHSLL